MIDYPFCAGPIVPAEPTRKRWCWCRLTDLARLATGHTPSRRRPEYWNGDIPWIQLPDIRALDGQKAVDTSEHITALGIENSAAVVLPAGTVCLSRTASVGFVTVMGCEMATSQDFVNWICGPDLAPDFLMHLFIACRRKIRDLGSGAVHHTIYFPTVESFSVCIPHLDEQRRIVAGLARSLHEAKSIAKAGREHLAAAESLPAAYLREAFEGPEAREWTVRRLGDVAPIQTGLAFKSGWFVEVGGVRILRNANIHQGFVEWVDVVAVGEDLLERFSCYSLEAGDIVLTLDRPIVSSGLKVARLTSTDLPALLNQRVARFRAIRECVEPDYLYAFLRSRIFMNSIRGHDQSLGVPHISPTQVENVQIPLPSLAIQRRVVNELSRRLEAAESLIARCVEELAAVDVLPAALLRAAFNGVA